MDSGVKWTDIVTAVASAVAAGSVFFAWRTLRDGRRKEASRWAMAELTGWGYLADIKKAVEGLNSAQIHAKYKTLNQKKDAEALDLRREADYWDGVGFLLSARPSVSTTSWSCSVRSSWIAGSIQPGNRTTTERSSG